MAVGVQIQWKTERLTQVLAPYFREKLGLAGEFITGRAKQLAPVDTGNLRNSIDWALGGNEENLWVIVGTPIDYGLYQELGFQTSTGRFIQNAYLYPALVQSINDGSLRRILG